ncbi:MAG: ABC transporter family substrate-binding protein [Microbacterium sp.]
MKRSRTAFIAAVAAAALMLTACGGNAAAPDNTTAVAEGGAVTAGIKQSWVGFNPYVTDQGVSAGLVISNAIFPSAFNVRSDQTAELNEDLLASAEITSEDPLTIEYVIQDDATWSDGEPITGDDFVYLWKHLNGSIPDLLTTNATGYSMISDVAQDSSGKKVTATFSRPFGDWRSLFSPILPSHQMQTLGSDPAAFNTGLIDTVPVSGGAFEIAENKYEEYLVLKKNAKWYGTPAHLDQVTLRFVGDDQAAIQALSSGDIDVSIDLKATRALIAQAQAQTNLNTEVVPTTTLQFINTQLRDPVIALLPVREAIATAIDPATLIKSFFGDGNENLIGLHHIFPPTSTFYESNRPDGFGSGDIKAARKFLTDAGFTPGADGIMQKDGMRLSTTALARAEDSVANQAGVLMQDTLKKVGIEIEVKAVASADYFPTLSSGAYGIGLGNMPATAFPAAFYSALYTCDGGYNFAKICSEKIDGLFDEAIAATDPEAQAKIVQEIDKELWAIQGNIPMFAVPALMSYNKRLQDIDVKLPKEWLLHDAQNWSVAG